jgi:hypothetical protein
MLAKTLKERHQTRKFLRIRVFFKIDHKLTLRRCLKLFFPQLAAAPGRIHSLIAWRRGSALFSLMRMRVGSEPLTAEIRANGSCGSDLTR